MKNLKSFCYRTHRFWDWKKTLKFDEYSETNYSSDISLSHPVFDPRRPVLLHIQIEFCCQTMNEVMSYLSNEFIENNSKTMKTLYYYICCELLTEIIECVKYLHVKNVIHRTTMLCKLIVTSKLYFKSWNQIKKSRFHYPYVTMLCGSIVTSFLATFQKP
jgi:serine/threonine protein kinase